MAEVRVIQDVPKGGVAEALVTVVNSLVASFNSHKHNIDGSAISGASDITGTPVTGTSTGTPAGGTAIAAVNTIVLDS